MGFSVAELVLFRFPKGAPMWEAMQAQVSALEKEIGPEFKSWVTLSRPEADAATAGGMTVVWLKSERGHEVVALGSLETKRAAVVLLEISQEKT